MTYLLRANNSGLPEPERYLEFRSVTWPCIWRDIAGLCGDVLTESQIEAGFYNSNYDGTGITTAQADAIAEALERRGNSDDAVLAEWFRRSHGFSIS